MPRSSAVRPLSVLALQLLSVPVCAAQAASAPASSDLLGYVSIPDLRGALSQMEAMAAAVAPGGVPPGTLSTVLGQKLGDPGLANLGRGPLVLMALTPPAPMAPPRSVLFVPVLNAAPYEAGLAGLGWKARSADGLLIGSAEAAAVGSAALAADYRRIAGGGAGGDLRVVVQAARVMETYGPLLKMAVEAGMAKMAAAPSEPAPGGPGLPMKKEGVARLLALEARVGLALLEQMEQVRFDVDLQPDGVLSDAVLTARPGTALHELSLQPPARPNESAALLGGPSIMSATYQLDGARLTAFLSALTRQAVDEPSSAALVSEVLAVMQEASRAYPGEAAVRLSEARGVLTTESALRVSDPAAAVVMVEKAAALLRPGGPVHAFYKDMGLPLTMKLHKNVRRRSGVAIHRLETTLEGVTLAEEQKVMQSMFMRDTEFAIAGGFHVSATDPAALDALIDRALSGRRGTPAVLHSVRTFGPDRHGYLDYDIFGLLRVVGATLPADKDKPNPFSDLPSTAADPLVYAFSLGQGTMRIETRMPLRPFVLLAQASRKTAKTTP